jgi:hypothetical protein
LFEPNDSWFEGLPPEPAFRRVEESPRLELWPDIGRDEAIGLGWSLLVGDRAEQLLEWAPGIPGFRWPAVGILDPEVDRGLGESRQQFGVIFYAEDPQATPTVIGQIEVEDVALPISLRPISYREQASPPPLPDGTLACWATSAGGRREGWLTARHVALGGGYNLVDCGRECIDAALIDLGSTGSGVPRRAVAPFAGARIQVEGPHPASARILDVAVDFGITASSFFPMRFTTSSVGRPGDSGSLILADPRGEPLGIYLGAAQLEATGQEAGVGLAVTQLEQLMKMEVYL